ncbi:unnamed protein product [Ixodes pacificus]
MLPEEISELGHIITVKFFPRGAPFLTGPPSSHTSKPSTVVKFSTKFGWFGTGGSWQLAWTVSTQGLYTTVPLHDTSGDGHGGEGIRHASGGCHTITFPSSPPVATRLPSSIAATQVKAPAGKQWPRKPWVLRPGSLVCCWGGLREPPNLFDHPNYRRK